MTSTKLLSKAAQLIMSPNKTLPGPYGLFVTDKKLDCCPLRLRIPGDIFIMRFTKEESEKGLLSSQWDRLEAALRKLRQEGVL